MSRRRARRGPQRENALEDGIDPCRTIRPCADLMLQRKVADPVGRRKTGDRCNANQTVGQPGHRRRIFIPVGTTVHRQRDAFGTGWRAYFRPPRSVRTQHARMVLHAGQTHSDMRQDCQEGKPQRNAAQPREDRMTRHIGLNIITPPSDRTCDGSSRSRPQSANALPTISATSGDSPCAALTRWSCARIDVCKAGAYRRQFSSERAMREATCGLRASSAMT